MVTRQYRTIVGSRIDAQVERRGNVIIRNGRCTATCSRCGQHWSVRLDRLHIVHTLCRDCRSVHDPLWSTP